VTLSTDWDVTSVEEVDVLERSVANSDLQLADSEVTIELGANELKTLLYNLD